MNNSLISVIIPSYNVEKYIGKCIESVINQTYLEIEIIIINDGSTDNTLSVCQEYALKDKRIKIINQDNKGIAEARNIGIAHANGEYICWIDSDDYMDKNIIKILYSLIKDYSVDLAICDYIKGTDEKYEFKYSKDDRVHLLNREKALAKIYENNHSSFIMNASWAKLIKKQLYTDIKYPSQLLFEDIYMSHKLIARCHSIAYVESPLYYYYQRDTSILGKSFNEKKLHYLIALKERISFFNDLNLKNIEELALKHYLHSLIWEFSRAKDILKNKELVNKIVKEYRKYYRFGIFNEKYKHETKLYMLLFYISPYLTDLIDKMKSKVGI